MAYSLAELAELVGGRVLGTGDVQIMGVSPLGAAKPGEITLIDTTEKSLRQGTGAAAATIVPRGVVPPGNLPAIEVDDVHCAFTKIVLKFRPARPRARVGRSPLASVSLSARLAYDVDVHPGATVGDDVEIGAGTIIHPGVHILAGCKIGANVTIFPNAVLYEDTVVGDRSIIHAGVIIGGHGFGYKTVNGRHEPAAQLGNVEIGADVEVGAGTTIDRGTYGRTVIGEGTKIDNQVQVAHNCQIGRYNLLCAQVGVAGSTITGEYVIMAGQVGVRDHVCIGDKAVLGAMSGVSHDVPAGMHVLGIPAIPERDFKLRQAALSKLPDLRRQMKAIEAAVARLEKQAGLGEQQSAA
jgi:UDP-3-O-[3-hydroxymyristoyl] glucosamine N-acyltransferase